jgi:MYXO-CTERM domain-containing protein
LKVILFGGALLLACGAQAAVIFDFNAPLAGQPAISGDAPFARLTISNAGTNTVHFSLEHFVDSNNVDPTRFLSELELNFAPYNSGIAIGNGSVPVGFATNEDGINDASYRFDLQIGFPTANNGTRVEQGDVVEWDLFSTGLTESMFNSTANHANGTPSNVYALLHMQSIGAGGNGSTKLVASQPVPEPATLTALALFGLAALRRRRS